MDGPLRVRLAGRAQPRIADPHWPHPRANGAVCHVPPYARRRSRKLSRPSGRASQTDGRGMEVRPAYRHTEVGSAPEDWERRGVGDMGHVLTGKALAVNAPGEQRPYLRT